MARISAAPNSRGSRARPVSAELFGWLILVLGSVTLIFPCWVQSLLHLPSFALQGPNYFRLVGLLVGGLGMLYVVGGSLVRRDSSLHLC